MMEATQDTLVRFSLVGNDKQCFLSALAKIYREINKPGFNKWGLEKDELIVFNDVVEQIAINNVESND